MHRAEENHEEGTGASDNSQGISYSLCKLIVTILDYLEDFLIGANSLQLKLHLNACGQFRDLHQMIVNGFSIEHREVDHFLPQFQFIAEKVKMFCDYARSIVKSPDLTDAEMLLSVESKLSHLFLEIIPVEMEAMHMCFAQLKASESTGAGTFKEQLLKASPDILSECLILLQGRMIGAVIDTTSAQNIHVMMELLLIILADVQDDVIHHHELLTLLGHVALLTKHLFVLVRAWVGNAGSEENMNKTRGANGFLQDCMELLKKELKYVYLKPPKASSQLCFPKSMSENSRECCNHKCV